MAVANICACQWRGALALHIMHTCSITAAQLLNLNHLNFKNCILLQGSYYYAPLTLLGEHHLCFLIRQQ